jgi:type 1 glutamine amidotransferase
VSPYRWLRHAAVLTVALVAVSGGPAQAVAHKPAADKVTYTVLVYTRATGYRHPSIPAGVAAIKLLGKRHHFAVETTANPAIFTDAKLSRYATVVFLSTTGNPVPTAAERAAFQRYIEDGGGFVGVHAASDGSWDWAWYGGLVGAYFSDHPQQQLALVHIEDHHHPATAGLSDQYRLDEWYDFRTDPRPSVRVLADVDDSTYTGSTMGDDHPITWCQDYDGGRSFYTALGHASSAFTDPFFLHQLLGGIQSTAGVLPADCSPR